MDDRPNHHHPEKPMSCWFPFKEAYARRRIKPASKEFDQEVNLFEYDETSSQQGATELVLEGHPMPSLLAPNNKSDESSDVRDEEKKDEKTMGEDDIYGNINANCLSSEFWTDEIVEANAWTCLEENLKVARRARSSNELRRPTPPIDDACSTKFGYSPKQPRAWMCLEENLTVAPRTVRELRLPTPPTEDASTNPNVPNPRIEVVAQLRQHSFDNSIIERQPSSELARRAMCSLQRPMNHSRSQSFQNTLIEHEEKEQSSSPLQKQQPQQQPKNLSPELARRAMCGLGRPRSQSFQKALKEQEEQDESSLLQQEELLGVPPPLEIQDSLLANASQKKAPCSGPKDCFVVNNPAAAAAAAALMYRCGTLDYQKVCEIKTPKEAPPEDDPSEPHFYIEVEATPEQLNEIKDIDELKDAASSNHNKPSSEEVELARTSSLVDIDSAFMNEDEPPQLLPCLIAENTTRDAKKNTEKISVDNNPSRDGVKRNHSSSKKKNVVVDSYHMKYYHSGGVDKAAVPSNEELEQNKKLSFKRKVSRRLRSFGRKDQTEVQSPTIAEKEEEMEHQHSPPSTAANGNSFARTGICELTTETNIRDRQRSASLSSKRVEQEEWDQPSYERGERQRSRSVGARSRDNKEVPRSRSQRSRDNRERQRSRSNGRSHPRGRGSMNELATNSYGNEPFPRPSSDKENAHRSRKQHEEHNWESFRQSRGLKQTNSWSHGNTGGGEEFAPSWREEYAVSREKQQAELALKSARAEVDSWEQRPQSDFDDFQRGDFNVDSRSPVRTADLRPESDFDDFQGGDFNVDYRGRVRTADLLDNYQGGGFQQESTITPFRAASWKHPLIENAPSLDESFQNAAPFSDDFSNFSADFDQYNDMQESFPVPGEQWTSMNVKTDNPAVPPRKDNQIWFEDDSELNSDMFRRYEGDEDDSIFGDLKAVEETHNEESEEISNSGDSKVSRTTSRFSKGDDVSKYSRGDVSKYTEYSKASQYSRGEISLSSTKYSKRSDVVSVVADGPFACIDRWLDDPIPL